MEWHTPTSMEDALNLLRTERSALHGGGTGLLAAGIERYSHLVDLAGLDLDRIAIRADGSIDIGATCTFAETAQGLDALQPGHILVQSLSRAASTPLRNRITIGGSLGYIPPWSDLAAPLAALDATVHTLSAEGERETPFPNFLDRSRQPPQPFLVTDVTLPPERWKGWYHRLVRTAFDYPRATMAILLQTGEEHVREARIAVGGTRGRVTVLAEVAGRLQGHPLGAEPPDDLLADTELAFPDKPQASGEYLAEAAKIWLFRGIRQLLEVA
ncbi:MAG: FAD binding domain-containing protein [Synergistales bacterium]|nr:FAD binding domain-containing protein [Synergistales bacterium]